MGLAGEPGYAVELERGRVVSTALVLRLEAEGAGVAGLIPRAELPMALPVVLEGLNPNWPTVLVDRASGRWRPLGMLGATAYATVDTEAQDWNLYVGHPVTASRPEVVLSLTQIAPEEWMLEAHNPTDEAVEVTVQPAEGCGLLDWAGASWRLAAGTSRMERVRGRR
jgi:hypothetical protein